MNSINEFLFIICSFPSVSVNSLVIINRLYQNRNEYKKRKLSTYRPVSPKNPVAWHSSTNTKALYLSANLHMSGSGATLPSIENTPSVTIIFIRPSEALSCCSKSNLKLRKGKTMFIAELLHQFQLNISHLPYFGVDIAIFWLYTNEYRQ